MAAQQRFHSSTKGFTLIELLVVVGIMALVAGGVIMVYDDVQRRAELSVAKRQLAFVRDALLRFRVDMGHFPGEGSLAPANVYLDNFYYLDGANANTQAVTPVRKQEWAIHQLNLWMLFEKPIGKNANNTANVNRWNWNPAVSRGWQGPYLSRTNTWLLDSVRSPSSGYTGTGAQDLPLDRIYAVSDLISRGDSQPTDPLRWVQEDKLITDTVKPTKKLQPNQGRPIAFIRDSTSAPGWIIYKVVSAGANGIFETIAAPAGDDIVVEVTRKKL